MQSIDIWNQIRDHLLKHIISVCSYLELCEEILDPGKYLRIKNLEKLYSEQRPKPIPIRSDGFLFVQVSERRGWGKLNIIG